MNDPLRDLIRQWRTKTTAVAKDKERAERPYWVAYTCALTDCAYELERALASPSPDTAPGARYAEAMAVVEAARRWRHAYCGTKTERRERGLKERASEVFAALRAFDAAPAPSPSTATDKENDR